MKLRHKKSKITYKAIPFEDGNHIKVQKGQEYVQARTLNEYYKDKNLMQSLTNGWITEPLTDFEILEE